jgi:hypothetical protein
LNYEFLTVWKKFDLQLDGSMVGKTDVDQLEMIGLKGRHGRPSLMEFS